MTGGDVDVAAAGAVVAGNVDVFLIVAVELLEVVELVALAAACTRVGVAVSDAVAAGHRFHHLVGVLLIVIWFVDLEPLVDAAVAVEGGAVVGSLVVETSYQSQYHQHLLRYHQDLYGTFVVVALIEPVSIVEHFPDKPSGAVE